MKRFAAVLLTLAVLLCPSVRAAGPGISAASAILIDGESGRVLYAQNAEEERPIASITKLMTALVAVESHPDLSEVVTIRPEWTGVEGSSMYLKAGEELTLEALLYGLLLASGNDAAVAIAGFCAGDVDTFVAWMNDKAAELGMEHTHFENPNGLNDEGHYSTAADMAALARVVMEHEALAKIVVPVPSRWQGAPSPITTSCSGGMRAALASRPATRTGRGGRWFPVRSGMGSA